jgi:hypothetical protein
LPHAFVTLVEKRGSIFDSGFIKNTKANISCKKDFYKTLVIEFSFCTFTSPAASHYSNQRDLTLFTCPGFFFLWHPFGVREVLDLVTGGIAALNHWLKASIPPGYKEIKGGAGQKKPSRFSAPGTPLLGM